MQIIFSTAGIGTGSFRAFMKLIENEMIDSDEDFLMAQDNAELDELDLEYERIQSAGKMEIKSLDQQIEDAKKLLVQLQEEMQLAKESVSLMPSGFRFYTSLK